VKIIITILLLLLFLGRFLTKCRGPNSTLVDDTNWWGKQVHNGKLSPRYIGPFLIFRRVGEMAYQLELPASLSDVHNVFHVSQLKKCLRVPEEQLPMEELSVQDMVVLARLADGAKVEDEVVDNGVGGGELAAQPGDEVVALVDEPGDGLGHGGAGGQRGDDGGGGGHRRASLTTAGRRIAQPAMP
ncbi:hypothetical protein ACJX0J_031497, partial [Zea mays]